LYSGLTEGRECRLDQFWQNLNGRLEQLERKRPWLARQTGISLNTIHGWATKKVLPRADEAVRIARALETSVESLVGGADVRDTEQANPEFQAILRMIRGRPRDQLVELRGVIRSYLDTHFKEEQRTGT
jgi:transcriptional regulator with XRE-family HTH domain